MENGFGYIIIRSPYIPYSIYLRGTIVLWWVILGGFWGIMGIQAKLQKVRQEGGVKARARGGNEGSKGIEERAVAIQRYRFLNGSDGVLRSLVHGALLYSPTQLMAA